MMSGIRHSEKTQDRFQLNRFLEAQEPVYSTVVRELQNGRKYTHWMWFIFPQASGLGYSSTSKYYAIRNKEEAEQYVTTGPSAEATCSPCSDFV
jgi:uncharacterized protein (DUF1810 family)